MKMWSLIPPAFAPAFVLSCVSVAAQPASVTITGGSQSVTITASELSAMPRTSLAATAHGVTGTWEGVSMRELLTRAGVPSGEGLRGPALATAIVVTGADGYRAVFGIAEFDPGFTDRTAILADKKGGPLATNAAPFQLVISDEKRPARWVRQVVSIEVVSLAMAKQGDRQ